MPVACLQRLPPCGVQPRGAPVAPRLGNPLEPAPTSSPWAVSATPRLSRLRLETFALAKAIKGVAQALRSRGRGGVAPPNDDRALGRPILAGAKIRRRLPRTRPWASWRRQDGAGRLCLCPRYASKLAGRGPLRAVVSFGGSGAAPYGSPRVKPASRLRLAVAGFPWANRSLPAPPLAGLTVFRN